MVAHQVGSQLGEALDLSLSVSLHEVGESRFVVIGHFCYISEVGGFELGRLSIAIEAAIQGMSGFV